MKKLHRIIPILLALVMVLSLCACGGKSEPAQQSGTPATEAPKDNPVVPTPEPAPEPTEAPKSAATNDTSNRNPDAVYGGFFTNNRAVSPAGGMFGIYRSCGDVYVAPAIERLIRLDPLTNEIVPLLAKSVEADLENNKVTVKLQEGVKFHDGSDMTAEVVKWNMEFMAENGQGNAIRNPSKIECPDDYTLVITYPKFTLDAPESLTNVQVYSKKAYDDNGLEWCQQNPVGTGPFIFKSYTPDVSIDYVRNDNYWQEGLPYLDEWHCFITNDQQLQMSAFATGEITCMNLGNPLVAQQMVKQGYAVKTADVHSTRAFWTCFVNNKVEGDPWNDLKVRQAVLLYGLDYEAMTKNMGYPVEWTTKQINGTGALLYDESLDGNTYDPDKAKAMLAEAGYPDGFKTNIYAQNSTQFAATIYQAELKKLGIEAEIITVNSSDERQYDGTTPGMFIMYFIGAYDAISGIVDRYFQPEPQTKCYGQHIQHLPEYGECYQKALEAHSWEERAQYGKRMMEMLIYDECVVVGAFYNCAFHFIQDYAHDSGFEYNTYLPEVTWVEPH